MNVSAVIPTRGNVDMSEILDSLPRDWQKVVWDNSQRDDYEVMARYLAIEECEHDAIYTQDDDCVLDPASLEDLVEQWRVPSWTNADYLVANMPLRFRHDFYADHCLVGFGAMFHRDLPGKAFDKMSRSTVPRNGLELGELRRTCDIVFTGLTPRILVDLPYRDLPWASDPDRMWKQPDHVAERTRMLDLVRQVRDA